MKQLQAKVVVIGGGTAGMGAFHAARAHTDEVYLIEGHAFGTTCARVGCMPSKLLIAAADAAHHAAHTAPFGVHVDGSIRVDGREVMQRVKAERDRFVGFVRDTVASWPAERLLKGHARFIDEHTIQVDDHSRIHAERIVIATGSRAVSLPQWQQALGERLIINDDVFAWDTLPESVAIFGPGVIGLELGQALHRLGVRVHLFGRGGSMPVLSDPVVLEEAKNLFGAEFPMFLDADTEVSLDEGGKVRVRYRDGGQQGEIRADYLLAAIGRTPNVDHLGLDVLDIRCDARGVPQANPLTMQTSIAHIFIAGDASNQLPLLHEASDQGRIAGNNAGRYPDIEPGLRRSMIGVVFTDPQIATVGARYSQLLEQAGTADAIAIGEVSFADQGRSRVMLKNRGHLRVYAEQGSGLFLGAEMIGPAAEHIAHLLAWAHQQKMTVQTMLEMPFYHPVVEEGLRTALRGAASQLKAKQVASCDGGPCPGE